MTLHTRIAVLDPIPVRELFYWVNENLLHVTDSIIYEQENKSFIYDKETETGNWELDGSYELGNQLGQGFDAWFWINYRPDGPLNLEPTYYDEDSEETAEPTDNLASPAMALEVNFDTAYSYRSDEGYTCSVLHATYIVKLCTWLSDRGIGWQWYNEYAGTWHDSFEPLEKFMGDGDSATFWFDNKVRPLFEKTGI